MPNGFKHLISCKCILPQYSKLDNPPFHKFLVFSIINDDDLVEEKFAQCNNCDAIHRVTDICTSKILNKDELRTIVNVEDIKLNLDGKLVATLERYKVDLPTYEAVQFIIQNERWGDFVTLSSEEIDGELQYKYIRIMGNSIFKIDSQQHEVIF